MPESHGNLSRIFEKSFMEEHSSIIMLKEPDYVINH
jgi:hypothetical protein